jgi:23S rRNA-/tRNA-specific pseudouridylate synthase
MQNSLITFSLVMTEDSKRIESLLRDLFPEVSRAKWRVEIEEGRVRLNDRRVKVGTFVREKDSVSLGVPRYFKPGRERIQIDSSKMPKVVFEDENIFVFDKPRAIHSVLLKEDDPVTLADYAVTYYPEALYASPKELDGGLVQRLDYYTSGLCIVAKTRETWELIHSNLINHKVLKTYQAKVDNKITSEYLQKAVGDGLFTGARIVSTDDQSSLVEVALRDGSRHIVRKSLSRIGFPLIGDVEYKGAVGEEEGFYLRCVRMELPSGNSMKTLTVLSGLGGKN